MDDLPNELLDRIAHHLPMRSLQALACVNKRMGAVVDRPIEWKLQRLTRDIQQFSWGSGLDVFHSLLSTIRLLRPDEQAEPLHALCARIRRLPEAQCMQAATSVLKLWSALPQTLVAQLEILSVYGSPAGAVIAGLNVQAIAACFELIQPESTHLMWAAYEYGPAVARIAKGERSYDVSRELGIIWRWFIGKTHKLNEYKACLAMRQGMTLDEVMERFGLAGKKHVRARLMRAALDGVAGEAVACGENVRTIAKRVGFRSRNFTFWLAHLAVCGAAGVRAMAGEKVSTVAERHGIRFPEHRLALLGYAMEGVSGTPVRRGLKTVEQVAVELHEPLPALTMQLKASRWKRSDPLQEYVELPKALHTAIEYCVPVDFLKHKATGVPMDDSVKKLPHSPR